MWKSNNEIKRKETEQTLKLDEKYTDSRKPKMRRPSTDKYRNRGNNNPDKEQSTFLWNT